MTDAPRDAFMFAQVAVEAAFDIDGLSTVYVRFVQGDFSDNYVVQLVDNGRLADADYVLLVWSFDGFVRVHCEAISIWL